LAAKEKELKKEMKDAGGDPEKDMPPAPGPGFTKPMGPAEL